MVAVLWWECMGGWTGGWIGGCIGGWYHGDNWRKALVRRWHQTRCSALFCSAVLLNQLSHQYFQVILLCLVFLSAESSQMALLTFPAIQ